MIITFFSWLYIAFITIVLGVAITKAINKLFNFEITSIASYLMIGITTATIYAEYYSIFHRVGRGAINLLSIISILLIIIFYKDFKRICLNIRKAFVNNKVLSCFKLIVLIGIIIFGSYLTSRFPGGYDTENYHAPSIRWIEEYGVVNGLGNLHTRFAYNSAFLCLQALFSFSWFYKMSMHSMNGFLWVYMTTYCFLGLFCINERKLNLSDLLRILCLFILFRDQAEIVASPNTDFMPLCLTAYIFIKWCRLVETNINTPIPYGLLAILGLFSASVKLSCGVLFILAFIPLFNLIKNKNFIKVLSFCLIGCLVFLPYVIRNVIISGYLLYPVASIDLFNFDWEIPKSVILSDNIIIKTYARNWGNGYSIEDWSKSFFNWFTIWVQKAPSYYGVLGLVNLIISPLVIFYIIYEILAKKCFSYKSFIPLMAVAGFLFLLFSAPSARFGLFWFWFLPLVVIYHLINSYIQTSTNYTGTRNIISTQYSSLFCIIFLIINISHFYSFVIKDSLLINKDSIILKEPLDYSKAGARGQYYEINGYKFFYYAPNPASINSLNSYYGFPGTETLNTLSRIRMRDKEISQGFQAREECLNIPYNFQGNIQSANEIQIMGLSKYYSNNYIDNYADAICIRAEDFSSYSVNHTDISFYIDSDSYNDSQGIRTIYGWCFQKDAKNSNIGDIYLRCGDKYYKCNKVARDDVANHFALDNPFVGFTVYISDRSDFELCLVNKDNKVIYKN